jgi:hypothetical protein
MDYPASEIAWLERFFGVPNELIWGHLNDPRIEPLLRDELTAWLSILADYKDEQPILLPRITGHDVRWYACSKDPQTMAQVREEMEALVAHSYAQVEAHPALDPTDPCESALLEHFGNGVCTIDILAGCHSTVLHRFEIYRHLLLRRPRRLRVGVRPVGRIRSDFDKALLAGNLKEARALIEEMRCTGRLSLENQRFLEIRLLAVQEKWQVIVSDPAYLRSVVDLALPPRIVVDLVDAVYQVFLQEYEESADPQGAIAAFKELVLPKYGRLFRARKGLKTPTVLKAFLLDQLCSDSPELTVCQKLVAEYQADQSGFDFIQGLLGYAPKVPVEKDLMDRAKAAFDDDKVEVALELYSSCPPDKDVLAKVLRCSRDVEAKADLGVAWKYCLECPEEWFDDLSGKQLKDYLALKEAFEVRPIRNWFDWITFVLEGGDRKEAENIAQYGVTDWSLDDFLADQDGVERFCALLSEGVSKDPDFFQGQFTNIYEFASGGTKTNSQLRPLYGVLLEFLAYSDSLGASDLILAQELIRSLFEIGILDDKKYQEIIELIDLFWATAKSFKYLDWALDMAEILAIYPSPNPELRLKFFNDLLGLVAISLRRVEPSTWMVLDLLAQDYNTVDCVEKLKPVVGGVEEVRAVNPLAGKKVGIYSLTEQAAIRAKQLLESMYPGVDVEINHDHEATQALENLSKSSDYFVFAWRSSKHQAYYCVKKFAQKLILTNSKGSTGIIKSIVMNL